MMHPLRKAGVRKAENWYNAASDPANTRNPDRKQQRAPVERQVRFARYCIRRNGGSEEFHDGECDTKPGGSARQSDHQAFREKLSRDPARSGTKCDANRNLAAAGTGSGKREIDKIC